MTLRAAPTPPGLPQVTEMLVTEKPLTAATAGWARFDVSESALADRWVQAAILTALVVRLFRLGEAPLWFDETITANWIALPWADMIRAVLADNHPPLYFILLNGWSALFGHSPWALRLPSVLVSLAAVPLCAAIAGHLAGPRAQRWAAWLAALSPYLLHHAQEARMYPLTAALSAAQLLFLVRFVTGASSALGASFVLATLALVASHYYGGALVAGEMLVLLVLRPRPLRAWLPGAALACLIAFGAFLSAALLAKHSAGGAYEMGLLALPGTTWAMLSGYTLLPDSFTLHDEGVRAALPYLPMAIAGGAALCVIGVLGLRSLSRTGRVVVLATLGTALIWPFAIRVLLDVGIHPRYCVAGLPALITLIAAGMAQSSSSRASMAAAAALALVMLVGAALHLADPAHGREDIGAAGAWLDEHVALDEEILVSSNQMAQLARFHWPARRVRVFPARRVAPNSETAEMLAEQLPFPGPDRAIYMIGRSWVRDPKADLQRSLTDRYADCGGTRVRGIRILCLRRSRDDG